MDVRGWRVAFYGLEVSERWMSGWHRIGKVGVLIDDDKLFQTTHATHCSCPCFSRCHVLNSRLRPLSLSPDSPPSPQLPQNHTPLPSHLLPRAYWRELTFSLPLDPQLSQAMIQWPASKSDVVKSRADDVSPSNKENLASGARPMPTGIPRPPTLLGRERGGW